MSDKTRLDAELFSRALAPSREKAKALIMAGLVYVDGIRELKAGRSVTAEDSIEVRGKQNPYVSRGGLKLHKAVEVFGIILDSAVCLDVGASTGGFTDCMLKNGASKVYSVDVGYGQLAWELRSDERVINLERTNFRYATKEIIPEDIDFASADVSFISLKLILPVMRGFLRDGGRAVCLIKPQFEAGRENVGKKGVVRDKSVHESVITDITAFAVETGFSIIALDYSPIKGPEGNIEYLMYIEKSDEPTAVKFDIHALVELSHTGLEV